MDFSKKATAQKEAPKKIERPNQTMTVAQIIKNWAIAGAELEPAPA